MNFDVYYPFFSKQKNKLVPGVKPVVMSWARIKREVLESEDVRTKIENHRKGVPDQKIALPAICFTGRSVSTRLNSAMIPTQFFMVDIDHCKDADMAWNGFHTFFGHEWCCDNVLLAHKTPSLGLHVFLKAQPDKTTLIDNMKWMQESYDFSQWGDFDTDVHDFARLSFAFLPEDILFENAILSLEIPPEMEEILVNPAFVDDSDKAVNVQGQKKQPRQAKKENGSDIPIFTEEEEKEFADADWRGVKLQTIIDAWVKFRGQPGKQEIHNYYNEMIKYFRNIMGNNKRLIFYLLPKFGHTDEECWSQIKSICRVNTLSTIDKPFYFFLKDNGFYKSDKMSQLDQYLLSEDSENDWGDMPPAPPVFREFINMAPKDFRVPTVCALMPILGTLASYVKAKYPFDDRWHTPSFFSVIYAPPSSGKGFVGRMDFLFEYLEARDYVQNAREQIYLQKLNQKGANEKSPEMPHTSLRIIPPKNSEAEFLQKQQDNHGYHMYTYAAEMDSWAKGEKAAGGNKSDMIRMAWDNEIYGQQFKSASTFKGRVRLYWNVLITGTQNQIEKYFKDVENGLVTRCSFCEVENQEFVMCQIWKPMSKRGMDIVRNFMKRCDDNTYEEPCTITADDLVGVSDDNFDSEVNWQFKFRKRKVVNMDWLIPTIVEFQKETLNEAALDVDRAKDAFRRRVGVRGFRLGLLCTTCYPKMTKKAEETIKNFVKWWMRVDLDNMLRLWGKKYNEQTTYETGFYNAKVFDTLGETFTKNDLLVVLKKHFIKSPVRTVIYQWKSKGFIEKIEKDTYKKKKNEKIYSKG